MGMLVNILLTSHVSVTTSPTDIIRASMPITTGHALRAQTTHTVALMPCQDSQGITAFLLALSGIDRQDRCTIFSEILDLSIPIARSRADFAGKHSCAPAIDASSPTLAIDSFAWLCAPTRTPQQILRRFEGLLIALAADPELSRAQHTHGPRPASRRPWTQRTRDRYPRREA